MAASNDDNTAGSVKCEVCCLSGENVSSNPPSVDSGKQAHTCVSYVLRLLKEIVGVATFTDALERVKKSLTSNARRDEDENAS